MELSSSTSIKKIPHTFLKERFSYISKNGTLHFSAQALKTYYASGNGKL